MAIALPALLIGSAVVQGVSAISQGNAQKKAEDQQAQETVNAAAAQKQQDDIAAQNAGISAEQDQELRLQQLSRTVGTIRANVAARGLDPSSPSSGALENAANSYAGTNITQLRFNAFQQASSDKLTGATAVSQGNIQAQIDSAKGAAAQVAGYTSAVGSLFKAASSANSLFSSAGGGGGFGNYTGNYSEFDMG